MGNKLGSQKSTKSKGDKKREQEEKKLQKKEQKAKKKSSKKSNKKLARGGFQNSGSEFDTDLESSHFTGADSESGVFHSAENLSTSPYLDSCTRSERENSGMWAGSSAASQHPQVLSSRDFRDGFSLEACIPPDIARPVTHYTDTTSCSGGGGGGGGSSSGTGAGDYSMGYRCYNNSSGSLRSKRSNSVKSHGQHHTPTSSRNHQHGDVMSGSTSSSQKSGHTGTGGYCTPLLNTPVFGRADRSISPHSGLPLSRVPEPDRDSMDIVPLPYSPFDPNAKVYTTYNPTIVNKNQQHHQQQQQQQSHHHHHYFHQPIDYRNLPKPTSPHPQRRAFSPKMTSAPFKMISSDESSSSPTTPIPQRKAGGLLSDLFRSGKKKNKKSASEDEEKSSFKIRKDKDSNNDDDDKQGSKSKKNPIWKTWERSNKRKSADRESKLSIFGTSRKREKKKKDKGDPKDKKDRSSDSTLQDFKIDNGDNNVTVTTVNQAITATTAATTAATNQNDSNTSKTTKSSTSSFENSSKGNSGDNNNIDFSVEKNRNSSPPVAKSAAFCIMRLEELERNIEKTIKEKFPDAEPFLLRKTSPEDVPPRGSKSLPTTPSLKKKLYVTRDVDFSSDDVTPSDLDKLSAKLESIKGATRYYNETFEDASYRAKSPVILRRFGARTRHASISPKIQRAKTAAIYNSPSEMERMAESKEDWEHLKEDTAARTRPKTPVFGKKSQQISSAPKSDTVEQESGTKQPDKANSKTKETTQGRPLVRQHRIEEPDREDTARHKNNDKHKGGETSSSIEDRVIVSTASAVFGSVSPKLKRHHKENREKSKSRSPQQKETSPDSTTTVIKRNGDPGPNKQTTVKRKSGSLDSLLDAAAASAAADDRACSRQQPRGKDKQSKETCQIKSLAKPSPDKLLSQTASNVFVRSRVKSINKSLSEDVAGCNYNKTPLSPSSNRAHWGSVSLSSDESNQPRLSAGSHHSRPDTNQSQGDSKGERIQGSNVRLGVSPNLARKHSADHVIFGTAVALPCRVFASPVAATTANTTADNSTTKITSPVLSKGSRSKNPSPPSTHVQNSVKETRNAKKQECQKKKALETESRVGTGREGIGNGNRDGNYKSTPVKVDRSREVSRTNGRGEEGAGKCVRNDNQLCVSGPEHTTTHLGAGRVEDQGEKRTGAHLVIVCGDKRVDSTVRSESSSVTVSDGSCRQFEQLDSSPQVLTARGLSDDRVDDDDGDEDNNDDRDDVISSSDKIGDNNLNENSRDKRTNGINTPINVSSHSEKHRQNRNADTHSQRHPHDHQPPPPPPPHHHQQQQQQRLLDDQQPFVVLKQPISKVISDMINVSKQHQQQPQSVPRQSSPTTPDKDALVVETAIAMVTTPSFKQPLTTLEEGVVIRKSNVEEPTIDLTDLETDIDACLDVEEKDFYISSEGTGESDLERFIQSVKESENPRAVNDKSDFQESGESPKETKQQPPPPSPDTLNKLMAEFPEEDEDEDEDYYDDDDHDVSTVGRAESREIKKEINLALTRQAEIKEFTDSVINRLSDLLGSHSGHDDDDDVFLDETRQSPLLEGASYRIVRREDADVDEEETCSFFDNAIATTDGVGFLDTDFVLSTSTKDPIPAERIKHSRFSTSSSLSTSSSSSSSSGLFAPPPPPSSSMRGYEGVEGAPKLNPNPDFFVFPERLDDQDIISGYKNETYRTRSAQTRSYHSDDDVARGGGIPEYYDDRPLWSRRQKPPGQISAKMASIRRRERRERWLKKRRRNKTDLLSTCSSEVGSEQSLNTRSRLSLDDFEEDEEVAKLSLQRGALGSGILSSPKYSKPIMPFLIGRSSRSPEPAEEEFTCRNVSSTMLESSGSRRRVYDADYRMSKSSGLKGHDDSDFGSDSSMDRRGEKGDDGTIKRSQASGMSAEAAMRIPGLEETFDELVSVQQLLEGLQERAPAASGGALPHSTNTRPQPRAKFMALTAENIKSMKEQFKENNNGRHSRLSNTNRTESDLDLFSEYRDDASTDSNLYADDEEDDDVNEPYTTADDELSDATGGTDVENFVISCTFYNSSAIPHHSNASRDVNRGGFSVTAAGATSTATTTVGANRLSTPVPSVRNSTEEEFRFSSGGEVLFTNTSLRPSTNDPNTRSFTVNTNPNLTNRDAAYTRSNSAPGPNTGHQLSVAMGAMSSSNNAAAAANSDEEFWAGHATFERSYQQLEMAAGDVSTTFQDARVQMMDIQHHLQALRRQMEGLQEDLTSTSYTLTPDFSAYDSK